MRETVRETEVQWIHVALAAAVVLLVLLARAGSAWASTLGWAGAAVVASWWMVLLGRLRSRETRRRPRVGG